MYTVLVTILDMHRNALLIFSRRATPKLPCPSQSTRPMTGPTPEATIVSRADGRGSVDEIEHAMASSSGPATSPSSWAYRWEFCEQRNSAHRRGPAPSIKTRAGSFSCWRPRDAFELQGGGRSASSVHASYRGQQDSGILTEGNEKVRRGSQCCVY
jgi:hypothetical protein